MAPDDALSEASRTGRPVFRDGCVHVTIDTRCYRLSAVQKAGYRLADRCTLMLGGLAADMLPISFAFPRPVEKREALDVVRMFFQELLDQELREKIAEETGPIRALLLAHAFSKTDLIRRE
jgi:His-Xaa-Ser system protein HxsD